MKIEDKRKKRPSTFEDVYIGDAFEYDGMIWLKTAYNEAFNLENEEIDDFCDDIFIQPVKINIIIED